MTIRGAMHTAAIYSRLGGGGWTDTGTTLKGRLEPVSATVKWEGSQYPQSTHRYMADPSPVIDMGQMLLIDNVKYFVQGSQMMQKPGVGNHHQEIYVMKEE